jgi:DNA integrity scanning protein DisA with diadenylate cyclase activity
MKRVWQYEGSLRYFFERAAENIFQGLDDELRPGVFVIAFHLDQESGSQQIELVPEDAFCRPSDLTGLTETIGQLQRLESARSNTSVESLEDANREFGHASRALRADVENALNDLPVAKQTICFCSEFSSVGRFLVGIVLTLDRRRYDVFPSVPNELDKVQPYSFGSFLDAVIERFLATSTNEMRSVEPGRDMPPPNEKAILVDAAKRFTARPVFTAAMLRDYSLFDDLCAISSLPYEGTAVNGQIVMRPRNDADAVVLFQEAVPLNSHRAARKLVQLCSTDLCLLSERSRVYGLVRREPVISKKELCSIRFLRQHTWEMLNSDTVLMRVTLGEPSLPRTALPEKRLAEVLRRRFAGIQPSDINALTLLIRTAAEQKHGAMVVISAMPAEEAKRLQSQGTLIRPEKLDPPSLRSVTNIDGAVLVGVDGVCHAVGVILDGHATKKGSSARGARFNSAVRYVRFRQEPCVAVVISEDGTIDVHPQLMPQIKRSALDEALQRLRDFEQDGYRDHSEYMAIINWFEKHEFYLMPDICREVNEIVDRIGDDTSGNPMKYGVKTFASDEDMKDSYFI